MKRTEAITLAGIAALLCAGAAGGSPRASSAPSWNGPVVGYASETSLRPGRVLHLHVSTVPARRYRIEIRRRGWYGGAGSRRMACIPSCKRWSHGRTLPVGKPAAGTGYLRAAWPVTDTFRIPRNWPTGSYVALLRMPPHALPRPRFGSIIPFVVRPRAADPTAALVVMPVNTWQAYNNWGGKSLYTGASSNHVKANHVSFLRPYFFHWDWELPVIHFLEHEGYRLEYTTDVDVDRSPRSLRMHPLVIVPGHSEYWTKRMRDGFEAARAAGVSLAFIGANDGYWQMRYADRHNTIVEYKGAAYDPEPNPALKTDRFRRLVPPRPECELMGVEYAGSESSGEHKADYSVNPSTLPDTWFDSTGFRVEKGPLPGLVYQEWDSVVPRCKTPPLTVFFRYFGPRPAMAVRYRAPSGALVFSAGSLGFARGLDPRDYPALADARLVRFMENALKSLGATRAPALRTSSSP